jgi:hypothetical protein
LEGWTNCGARNDDFGMKFRRLPDPPVTNQEVMGMLGKQELQHGEEVTT